MWAAKLFGAGDIRVVECEVPVIGPDEILLKTKAAAICGSDLRMIENGYKGVDERHPLILGHEIAGEIAKVGRHVTRYRPGQRVSLAPNYGCGICDACVQGNTHLCGEYKAFGINIDGGFAEYVKIPCEVIAQGNITLLDDNITYETATMFEPASCALSGQQKCDIRPGDDVLVVGAGPIGVIHVLLARAAGASRVFIRDLSEERMLYCARLIPGVIPLTEDDLQEEVMRHTNGRGMDVCIVACSSSAMQAQSLGLMTMNGRVLYFGGLPGKKAEVTLLTNLIHYRQLTIHGSTRANIQLYRKIVKMSTVGQLDLSLLVSDRFPLSDFQEAVNTARCAQRLKSMIVFDN